jgi:hypothetical protein
VHIQQISPRELLNETGSYTQLYISIGSFILFAMAAIV